MMKAYQIADAHGMLSRDEVDLIRNVAESIPQNGVVVNIGAGAGTSSLAFLESHPSLYLFEIDIAERPTAVESTSSYIDRIARIRGKSQIVGINFPILLDAVFIDGNHLDEGVMGDINVWVPKVKKGGVILFHDYDHPKVPGLTRIVDEEMKDRDVLGKARFLIAYSA